MDKNINTATLAGGCFWCVEAVFVELRGVEKVESGYMGGRVKNPTYREICSGLTGHAEVVRVTFDADVITYQAILEVFMTLHDPTTLNRQGNDVGTQYRSAIFYNSEIQKTTAETVIKNFGENKIWNNPIVTELNPETVFYKAEDYHQSYYALNGAEPYCRAIIAPKVAKVRSVFLEKLKKS